MNDNFDNPQPNKPKRKYNNSNRARRAEAKALQKTLQAIDKFEQLELDFAKQREENNGVLPAKKSRKRKHRHRGSEEVQKRKERRFEQRERLLEQYCKSRRCPTCDVLKINSKQWVFVKTTGEVICKSCYKKLEAMLKPIAINELLIRLRDAQLTLAAMNESSLKDFVDGERTGSRKRLDNGN